MTIHRYYVAFPETGEVHGPFDTAEDAEERRIFVFDNDTVTYSRTILGTEADAIAIATDNSEGNEG